MIPNDRRMLDGYEVDIAIPSLRLAIEWNGAIHRKPIYGQATLDRIQRRDQERLTLAARHEIDLVVIDDQESTEAAVRREANRLRRRIRRLLENGD